MRHIRRSLRRRIFDWRPRKKFDFFGSWKFYLGIPIVIDIRFIVCFPRGWWSDGPICMDFLKDLLGKSKIWKSRKFQNFRSSYFTLTLPSRPACFTCAAHIPLVAGLVSERSELTRTAFMSRVTGARVSDIKVTHIGSVVCLATKLMWKYSP